MTSLLLLSAGSRGLASFASFSVAARRILCRYHTGTTVAQADSFSPTLVPPATPDCATQLGTPAPIYTPQMPHIEQRIGFMGSGQMAEALAKGLINKGVVSADQIW